MLVLALGVPRRPGPASRVGRRSRTPPPATTPRCAATSARRVLAGVQLVVAWTLAGCLFFAANALATVQPRWADAFGPGTSGAVGDVGRCPRARTAARGASSSPSAPRGATGAFPTSAPSPTRSRRPSRGCPHDRPARGRPDLRRPRVRADPRAGGRARRRGTAGGRRPAPDHPRAGHRPRSRRGHGRAGVPRARGGGCRRDASTGGHGHRGREPRSPPTSRAGPRRRTSPPSARPGSTDDEALVLVHGAAARASERDAHQHGLGLERDAERRRTPSRTSRASATRSSAVAPPRLVSASVCLRRQRRRAGAPKPRAKPECSMSHAALVLTRPSVRREPRGVRRQRRSLVGGQERVGEERAGAPRVGVGRVEHHALARAQPEHGGADVERAARARPPRRPACGRARGRRSGATGRPAAAGTSRRGPRSAGSGARGPAGRRRPTPHGPLEQRGAVAELQRDQRQRADLAPAAVPHPHGRDALGRPPGRRRRRSAPASRPWSPGCRTASRCR